MAPFFIVVDKINIDYLVKRKSRNHIVTIFSLHNCSSSYGKVVKARSISKFDLPPIQNSQDRPLFSAKLTPYRALSISSSQILILILGVIFFLIGTVFVNLGAWPVMGFLGLEIFLIWGAFRLNFFVAREYETVCVYPNEICVRGISSTGKVNEFRFNPRWVQLIIERMNDDKIKQIKLVSRGKGCLIGRFLNPEDLESFAAAFGNAISLARK